MKGLNVGVIGNDGDWGHPPVPKQGPAGRGVGDMGFQAAHDMAAVRHPQKSAVPVDQAGVQQFHKRREMRVVAIVRRGRQQQQPVGLARHDLGQAAALRILARGGVGGADAVMRLVDYREVPSGALQLLQHRFLFGEIEGGQYERGAAERVTAHFQFSAFLPHGNAVGQNSERQTEAIAHFLLPLAQQRAGGGDDQDTVGASPSNEFGGDQPGFDGLAEAYAIRQQQSGAGQFQRPHQGHKLIGLDPDSPGFGGDHRARAGNLIQQGCLVQQPPGRERPRPFGVQRVALRHHFLLRVQHIPFQSEQIGVGAAEAQALLLTQILPFQYVPRQAAGANACAGYYLPSDRVHEGPAIESVLRLDAQRIMLGLRKS